MSVPHIAIFGPTGRLGLLITNALLSVSSTAIVHAYARNTSKLPENITSNPRVKLFQGDAADIPSIRSALRGCNAAICAYLAPELEFMVSAQKTLIDACEDEHVPRYIASDWSLDWRPLELGDLPPKDPMIKIYRYLRDEKKGVKGVHIMNGAFTEMLPMFVQNGEMRVFGTGEEKMDFSCYATVAEWTARVALDPERVGAVKFREAEVSMNDIADLVGQVQGQRPKMINMGSLEDLVPKMEHVREHGPFDMTTFPVFYMYWMYKGTTSLGRDEDLDNDKYPEVKTIALKDWIAKNMQ